MHQGGRYLHAVFMCHLAVEKALKGLQFKRRNEFPQPAAALHGYVPLEPRRPVGGDKLPLTFLRIKAHLAGRIIFDGRNLYSPDLMATQCFSHFSLDRPFKQGTF
jgi:hypothetical protein